ncbi:MAG: Fibronectin type III domain protein [Stygiobacter sp.]|nr:MAG: Fibronectin type III domain protein [Stygiobacter sp.]
MEAKLKTQKYLKILILLIIGSFSYSCVESLSDTTTSTANPTIGITYPKTNDTIIVGKNPIYYTASDGSGGQGLSHFELFINGVYVQKAAVNTDGTNPAIYITVDSTMIGKTIKYYLIVYNKQGKLKISSVQENIYIKDKPPAAPTNLFASFTTASNVTLIWNDNSANEKGFELWRKDIGTAGVIDYRRIKTLTENTISTTDIGLSSFSAYYYKIRSFNSSGYSAFSDEVSPASSTGGPWNLRAEGIGDNLIRLTWTDFVPNENGFILEKMDTYTSSFKQLKVLAANTVTYDDVENIIAGATYTYRIQYFTTNYKSPYSNVASAATAASSISAPKLTAIGRIGTNGMQFTWDVPSSAKSYDVEIEWSTDGINFSNIDTIAGDTTAPPPPYTHTKADTRTINRYRIRLVISSTSNTYSPYSNVIGPL